MLHPNPCYYLHNPELVYPRWIGEKEKMEYENIEIGKDMPQLEAKKVKVVDLEERKVKFGEKESLKLVLKVVHPDGAVEMEIGKVTYLKQKKIKEGGLWLSKDKDGKIPFNSAVAHLMRYYKISKVNELIGKEIETASDDNGFIIAKAY